DLARDRGWMLATAESLTAGAVVARLVDVPGASEVVAGGAACYSLAAKTRVLGVGAELLERRGAVTAEGAAAMADGARDRNEAHAASRPGPSGWVWPAVAHGPPPTGCSWRASAHRCEPRWWTPPWPSSLGPWAEPIPPRHRVVHIPSDRASGTTRLWGTLPE